MPVISKIGAKSRKVRLIYGLMFLVLVVGAITMVYPLLLMLAGSVKSDTDISYMRPYPRFWFDDLVLFQKYVESKYNMLPQNVEQAWWRRIDNWQTIRPPTPARSEYLEDFLAWRDKCKWWWLGHSTAGSGKQLMLHNGLEFRRQMYKRFDGDIDAFHTELATVARSWSWLNLSDKPGHRYPPGDRPFIRAVIEFAETRPVRDRMIENLDAQFWYKHLTPEYGDHIEKYNEAHGTSYSSYYEVLLTRRVPDNPRQRKDWEEFVRDVLPVQFIRLSGDLADRYRGFLAEKYSRSIDEYNHMHPGGKTYTSFHEIPQPLETPEKRIDQVDYLEFVADRQACPAEGIEVYGTRQAFEEFVAERRGVTLEEITPIRLPIAEADWHDCMANTSDLRWIFTTRNYKYVLDYILLHGRGILNTVIYCALAVGLALLVNPLAAYALSRYKPPSTYVVLLFCMATMAFPGEVTMISGFMLLKRFPLWSLLGGGAAFGVSLWLLSKALKAVPELVRMALALAVGVVVGVWAVPAIIDKPHISLLNTFAALVLPGIANGFMIFLLKGFFDSLPRELYEAADIDGASEWTKFWSLTMGLSKPILAVLALAAFTGAYSAFMMALVIIPDEKMWTIMIWLFQLQHISHQAVVFASLVIAAVPTFLVFLFCQGIIIRGIVVPVEK
ncbi:MAG: carbohydrate ABC transporter permease [Desulfobacteraceae bacterium]|nr:carbohydrate ABC transporter permease [Desulfobacteraceae bacterium]